MFPRRFVVARLETGVRTIFLPRVRREASGNESMKEIFPFVPALLPSLFVKKFVNFHLSGLRLIGRRWLWSERTMPEVVQDEDIEKKRALARVCPCQCVIICKGEG